MRPPGAEHMVKNTASGTLHHLARMAPDEDFAILVRNGAKGALGAADQAVLLRR
jgi:hypothetical protein